MPRLRAAIAVFLVALGGAAFYEWRRAAREDGRTTPANPAPASSAGLPRFPRESQERAAFLAREPVTDAPAAIRGRMDDEKAVVPALSERPFGEERLVAVLSGRVLSTGGEAIPGARVGAVTPSGRWTEADERGAFELESAADGHHILCVEVRDGRHAVVSRQEVWLELGARTENVEFVVPVGAAVVGRVSDESGPVRDAVIRAHILDLDGRGFTAVPARPANDGSYRAGGLVAGTWAIVVDSATHVPSNPVYVRVPETGEVLHDVSLETGLTISGVVLDPEGRPVAGALVHPAKAVVADERGRFLVAGFAEGEAVHLGVEPPGWQSGDLSARRLAPATVEVLPGTKDVRVVLPWTGAVAGLVLDQVTRNPVPDAYVYVNASGPRIYVEGGSDGRFFASGVPPGKLEVSVPLTETHAGSVPVVLEVEAGRSTSIEILVDRFARVEGAVLALPERTPVAGAAVNAGYSTTTTCEAGRFLLDRVAPGLQELEVALEGRVSVVRQIDVPRGHVTVQVEVALPPASVVEHGGIEGQVLDTVGAVPPNAQVSVIRGHGWENGRVAALDADGRYEVSNLVPGTYIVRVHLTRDMGGIGAYDPIRQVALVEQRTFVRAGAMTRVDFTPDARTAAVRVHGVVRWQGEPLLASLDIARADLGDGGDRQDRRFYRVTDADGRYEVVLAPGLYAVGLWSPAFGHVSVTLAVPAGVAQANIDIDTPCGAVRGRVIDARTGKPRAGVRVCAFDGRDLARQHDSTADGAFELAELAPGLHSVLAFDDAGSARPVEIAVTLTGTAHVVLFYEAGLPLRGTVIEAANGRPVSGYVRVQWARGSPTWSREAEIENDGSFRLEGLVPGTHTLEVEGWHGRVLLRRTVDVETGSEMALALVVPPPGRVAAVVVEGPDAAPARGACLRLADEDGRAVPVASLPSDFEGRIHVLGIAPGRYVVTALLGHLESVPATVEVRAEQETAVRLELR